jgi:hypothetical protein
MNFYCDNCRETVREDNALVEQGRPYCPECGSVLSLVNEKKESEMNLFELSITNAIPSGVYMEIRNRLDVVLTYLEDGAHNTAATILREFLKK